MNLQRKIDDKPKMSNQEYQKLRNALRYSALKTWVQNRSKFVKEHVLGEFVEQDETVSTTMGSVIHSLLSGDFDDQFVLATVPPPTGQVLELTMALYKRSLKGLNEAGEQTENFQQLFEDAFNSVKYDYSGTEVAFKGKDVNKAVELFTTPDKKTGATGEAYYKELLACTGKQVVDINTVTQAEKHVEKLRTHPFTRDIVNKKSDEETDVYLEEVIMYEVEELPFRSMVDKLIVSHESRTITAYDYKTTWDMSGFEYSYTKNCYWIQVGLYYEALKAFAEQKGLQGYKIEPLVYIKCDTKGFHDPSVVRCSKKDVNMAWSGFTVNNRDYIGIQQIIESIKWSNDNGIWGHDMQLAKANGVTDLQINYQ